MTKYLSMTAFVLVRRYNVKAHVRRPVAEWIYRLCVTVLCAYSFLSHVYACTVAQQSKTYERMSRDGFTLIIWLQNVPTLDVLVVGQRITSNRMVATATKLAIKFSLIAVQITKSNAVDSDCSNVKLLFGNVSNLMSRIGYVMRLERLEFG